MSKKLIQKVFTLNDIIDNLIEAANNLLNADQNNFDEVLRAEMDLTREIENAKRRNEK